MVEKADAGDIIARRKIPILFDDTAYSLYKKMEKEAIAVLDENWPLIKDGKNNRIPQDLSRGTYFGGRKPEDGKIDWKRKNIEIYNLVRAVTHPWPGAFCFLRQKKFFIWQCKPLPVNGSSKPGNLISFDQEGIMVATGKGALLLKKCQSEGGEEVNGYELAQKYSLRKGEFFT